MGGNNPLLVSRRLGAIGAWMGVAVFVDLWIMVLVVLPRKAQLTMGTIESIYWDPNVFFSFLGAHPLLWRLWEPDIIVAPAFFLASWGLGRYLQELSPNLARLGALAGRMGAMLFLILAMIEAVAFPRLARVYASDPGAAGAAFHAIQAMLWAISRGAIFAIGWWSLLSSLAGWRTGKLPRLLCSLGFVLGVACILVFILPPLEFVAVIVGIVWLTWLGIVLVRRANTACT